MKFNWRPEVRQDPTSGLYYVIGKTAGAEYLYLHRDGVWRPTTLSASDQYTGYFPTAAAAEQALERALAGGDCEVVEP